MTYRVFDSFDIGVGLVFALFSAALCATLLLMIDFARNRGRHFETAKTLQRSVGMMVTLGIFFFVQVLIDDINWWKPTFGIGVSDTYISFLKMDLLMSRNPLRAICFLRHY
jgi:hypothetical protein